MKIKKEDLNQIIKTAKEDGSFEVCGILAGKGGSVHKVYKMTNTSDTPELCYLMDPKEQLKIMKDVRNLGLELAGIYHSHPKSQAYPSKKDVELAYYEDASYLIVSLESQKPDAKAFKIQNGKIIEDEVVIL